jgi:hypothetical protein
MKRPLQGGLASVVELPYDRSGKTNDHEGARSAPGWLRERRIR